MRNYFTFGDVNSADLGVYISGDAVFDAPEKRYDTIEIPGRSGDLLLSSKRLTNIDLTYPAFICSDFPNAIRALKGALMSQEGYVRLADTYYPDEFRMAYFTGPLTVDPSAYRDAGEFDLTFKCKPQRFLAIGETAVEIAAPGGKLDNPTLYPSRPLIRVTGYGTVTLGSQNVVVASGFPYVDIDSDAMTCSYGTQSAGSKVTLAQGFTELAPGETNIAISGSITKIEITPRWWVL